jgi:hypothetical protein
MNANPKPELYRQLKEAGLPLSRTYAQYTVEQLRSELDAEGMAFTETEEPAPAGFFGLESPEPEESRPAETPEEVWAPEPKVRTGQATKLEETTVVMSNQPDEAELPGQRLNTAAPDDVIRIDEAGRKWHQEEVRKPAYPKPRGRRVLKYMDTGVRKETVKQGEYVETFEVAGNEAQRPAEVKITLPSYQVGIYTDPRFPFKIHCYDGREGFNLQDVQQYFGGSMLMPDTCKRVYIENDLCYEIRSVIRTIQTEHRHLQLTGKIK